MVYMWRAKEVQNKCNVELTSFRSSAKENWYFDGGSSKHMTGEKNYIPNLKVISSQEVRFGDGAFSKIVGKRALNFPSLQTLNNMMLVEGFMKI
ncbi:gag-pol polyprotein [Cucumis melo var. makuwa]|uniref:Gag-pol polyprotein n=1 Tax=Cucumis melo var. makuwa TaxID=1194695 RepID=A0A5D3E3I8_CUCMM|nr:gag-pol polyprotein [Cucumis melo var. makuwa]